MKKLLVLQSSSIIIGTVIGAGILGLPFAFVKSGFLTGLLVLAIISLCMIMLSLFIGETTLRTKGSHQLTGYTALYVGPISKNIQAILLLFGMFSALLAYIIGQGEILANLLGGQPILWSIIIYAVLSFFVVRGLALIKRIEFIVGLLILGLLFSIGILAAPHMNSINLSVFDIKSFFIPYGAILFACSGLVSIPESKEILASEKSEKFLKISIIIGNLIPVIVYAIFAAIVVAVTGENTTEIATIGLSHSIGSTALIIGSLFSIIAMSSSFMTLGTAIKQTFEYDYKAHPRTAVLLTLGVPALLFALGFRDFFGIVSAAGALSVGLTGLISLVTFWRARKLGNRKPEYSIPKWLAAPLSIIIALVFIFGIIYTL